MKSFIRYTIITVICISVVFTAAAVALGIYFDPDVSHIEIEKDTRMTQGNFDGLRLELISAEKTADTVRIFFKLHLPEGISAEEVKPGGIYPHFPFAAPEGGYNYAIHKTEEGALTYEVVLNAENFPITAHPMTLEITDLISVTDLTQTVLDFTGELRFIVE